MVGPRDPLTVVEAGSTGVGNGGLICRNRDLNKRVNGEPAKNARHERFGSAHIFRSGAQGWHLNVHYTTDMFCT
eukprot:gene19338-biopygen23480